MVCLNIYLFHCQVVEKCFSREVNILITSQGTAKDYERPRSKGASAASPATPSPFNLASIKGLESPQPASPGEATSKKPVSLGTQIVDYFSDMPELNS
jgi:hypothetical protein